MPAPGAIFDSSLLRRRLARAAHAPADFLLSRTIQDLIDRLDTVTREFDAIADIGTPNSTLASELAERRPQAQVVRIAPLLVGPAAVPCAVADPEALPVASARLDLAVSALALQTANDLPGALVQIRRALKPNGLFLGALLGGRTLHELRAVLTEAESETTGGVSPRVAPFADVRDMGGLLQRAGFALPVADSDTLTVRYDHLFALMADLRAMAATNPLVARRRQPTARCVFLRAAELYARRYAEADGRIRATFEIIFLSGWAPHESQQPPARRGSAKVSLAAVLADRMPSSSKS